MLMDLLQRLMAAAPKTYTARILADFLGLAGDLLPYLAVSIVISAALSYYFKRRQWRLAGRNEWLGILGAALLGLLSPLPTYMALPLGISFVLAGLPFSVMLAFVIASPLMNPAVFFLTATQLGLELAVARTVAAFLLAVGGGLLVKVLPLRWSEGLAFKQAALPKKRGFGEELYRSTLFSGKYFAIAILIAAIIKALVSPELMARILGGNIPTSLLVAIALGVPFYSCGGAAIPIVQVLRDLGMNSGAMLAFFIAGPATKAETLFAFNSLLGWKTTLFYLLLTLGGAYLAGGVYWMIGQ
jgi:uncharacterized membrane protein YraQ (UPF0718 family)